MIIYHQSDSLRAKVKSVVWKFAMTPVVGNCTLTKAVPLRKYDATWDSIGRKDCRLRWNLLILREPLSLLIWKWKSLQSVKKMAKDTFAPQPFSSNGKCVQQAENCWRSMGSDVKWVPVKVLGYTWSQCTDLDGQNKYSTSHHQIVSEGKIQITILILRWGPCLPQQLGCIDIGVKHQLYLESLLL